MMNAKLTSGLIALFILFVLLFNAPFISIPQGQINGLPSIMIYIGVFWIILIILMGMISSFKNKEKD